MTPFNFALLAFATYRLARLIAVDDGPFDLFFRLRNWLGAYDLDETGQPATVIGRGISCPHCVGVYAALLLWILILLPGGHGVLWILAIAGAQSFLWSLSDR